MSRSLSRRRPVRWNPAFSATRCDPIPHSDDQAETPHPAAAVGRRAEGLGNDGDRSCRRDPCASGVRVGPVAERCGVGQLSATADEADVSEQPIGVGIGDGPTHVGARLDPGASSLDEAVCIFQAVALVDDVATQPRDRLRVRAGLLHPGGVPRLEGSEFQASTVRDPGGQVVAHGGEPSPTLSTAEGAPRPGRSRGVGRGHRRRGRGMSGGSGGPPWSTAVVPVRSRR